MRVDRVGSAVRSFCSAFADCFKAVFRSFRSMASQNVVNTWAGEGVSWGNCVGDGEGEGKGIDVDEGERPPWGAAVADDGCVTAGTPVEAALAPWNSTTPALSARKSERHASPVTLVKNHWRRGAR